eukprot:SAG31_NODE_43626_length_266_cov_0.718563_1_plen_20_part_01
MCLSFPAASSRAALARRRAT